VTRPRARRRQESDRVVTSAPADSVSLLLDDRSVFTGDLTHPGIADAADAERVAESWRRLRERGAARVYPGHGPIRPLDGAVAGSRGRGTSSLRPAR